MSLPCDVEADCAMESPAEVPRNKNLQFDPKYRYLGGGGGGGAPGDRFDSQDSGIDSFRSVDSAICFSADSVRETVLSSISEDHAVPLSQQFDKLHISSARREQAETRTEITKLGTTADEEDEAFIDGSEHETEKSLGAAGAETAQAEGFADVPYPGSCGRLTDDAFDQDQEGDTPLHLAIIHKEQDYALRFIQYTDDPDLLNIRNNLVQTPLHLSVLTRQSIICRALVLAGAQIDSVDRRGDTPLHIACKLSDDSCIRALTERVSPLEVQEGMVRQSAFTASQLPQNLELRNFDGFTCIHILGFLADFEHLNYLVQLGANVDAPDGKSGRTALHYAVEMDNLDLTHYLIMTLGADVDVMTFDLCTPLHLAVGRRLKPIVMLLMQSRADSSIVNFEGDRAGDLSSDTQMMMYLQNSVSDDDMMYTDIRIQGQ